jgi:hypothetical protein
VTSCSHYSARTPLRDCSLGTGTWISRDIQLVTVASSAEIECAGGCQAGGLIESCGEWLARPGGSGA